MIPELNKNKIILDLCGGTGAWSKPYKDAGYKVYNITLPQFDILKTRFINSKSEGLEFNGESEFSFVNYKSIYGILAAPPCTMFSLARTRAKTPRNLAEGMDIVEICMQIIWRTREHTKLSFWALENPMGYLRQFLGKPSFTFDPCDFGEHYTKKTDLWGYYNGPKKKFYKLSANEKMRCRINTRKLPSISDFTGSKQSVRRAITPAGFAKAFFKANQ